MNHSFDINHARDYGLHEAILINNLQFWIAKNRANGKHFHDGRTWTYNSVKAFSELFPYMTANMVRRALESLQNQAVIIKGNYNSSSYDRTSWIAFVDESIWLPEQNHLSNLPNGMGKKATSLTDINTGITTGVTTVGKASRAQAPAAPAEVKTGDDDAVPVPDHAPPPPAPAFPDLEVGMALDAAQAQAQAAAQAATPAPQPPVKPQPPAPAPAPAKPAPAPAPTSPAAVQRPEDVTAQTWEDWLALRKSKRAVVSVTVLKMARTEAAKAGMPLEDFLQVWCARGSQGLQAAWLLADAQTQRPAGGRKPAPDNFAEKKYVGGLL